jgi:hypothetical protein
MYSADILSRLVVEDLGLSDQTCVELLVHQGRRNWREQNRTPMEKITNLREGLRHEGPFSGELVSIGRINHELAALRRRISDVDVVSVTSRVFDPAGARVGHLAIMNLHTEGFCSIEALAEAISQVTGGVSGYLLESGRYYHFYGKELMSDREWVDFLTGFLMSCVLVSPRYIGHSLFRGFCSVRLTSSAPHKPMVPRLLRVL